MLSPNIASLAVFAKAPRRIADRVNGLWQSSWFFQALVIGPLVWLAIAGLLCL